MDKNSENKIKQLEERISKLEYSLKTHQHTLADGTSYLRKNIVLDADQGITIGNTSYESYKSDYNGTDDVFRQYLSVGPDTQKVGLVNYTNNMQLNLEHTPNALSFLYVFRSPLVSSFGNTEIDTTSGGNTTTIDGFNFGTNELAGALIDIYDSSGVFVETQTIASNTATVITISGTWVNSTNNGEFTIFKTVYLGSADFPFQRGYVAEGTAGGLRFGVGPTWTSGTAQNGLLYMDATGDIYWRNKSGTSTKLN